MMSDTETSVGGRVRKTTQKFTFSAAKEEEFSAPKGRGVKVRDMAFVKSNVEALGKTHHEMIKQLYNAMFGRRYQQKNMKEIKTHLLDFSGIIEQDEKSREHLVDKLNKWKLSFVHEVMDLLAVDRSKKGGETNDKQTLINRLIDWLYNPQETEVAQKKAALAAKKEKVKANKRAKAKAAAEKKANAKDKGPAKKKRKTTKKKAAAAASDEDEEEDDHENTESEGEESSSDFEEAKKPTKKRKATRRPKKSHVVESDNEESESESEGGEEKASTEQDKEQPAAEPEAEAETSIAEKEPAAEPLEAEVCDKVRDIIAHGNAEELTVKKIVRQLSADLGRDMSSQKKAIKEFITNDQAEI